MKYNLAILDKAEHDKINIDLIASAIAFKERHNMTVEVEQIENEQPIHLREYFRSQLLFYRKVSLHLTRLSI